MTQAWDQFARTGRPDSATPDWPAFDLPARPTMAFDTPPTVVDDPSRDERLAWAGVL
jgi:para-nitrobenzyl esterase